MFNDELFVRGTDIQEIFAQLGVEEATHAFYLGRELAKAKLAITLGKTYRQEGAARVGLPHAAGRRALGARQADAAPPPARRPPRAGARPDERPQAPLVDNLGAAGDPIDVVSRFLDLPYLLFLDSATGAALAAESHQLGRYSFLARRPRARGPQQGPRDRARRRRAGRGPRRGDPLVAVRELLAPFAAAPVPGLPPFQGGAAGYIGYD